MTPERKKQLSKLAGNRQLDLCVVLENVRDLHNVGAVLRTCDAVGVPEVHMVMSTDFKKSKIRMGKQTSAGARRWVDTFLHLTINDCLTDLGIADRQILGTALDDEAVSIHDIDFTQPTVIVFGNERDGLSAEARELIDQPIIIPQKGMVQSLNISVACAVTLYEIMRQRIAQNMYDATTLSPDQQKLLDRYHNEHKRKDYGEVDLW